MDWEYAWIDFVVLAAVGFSFYKGYRRGLINQVAWFGSFVIAYLIASRFCYALADRLGFTLYNEEITVAVVFVAVILSIVLVTHLLARLVSRILQPTIVGLANSILGGVFTSLIVAVVLLVVLNLGLILLPDLRKPLEKTWIAGHGAELIENLMERTPLDELARRFATRPAQP